MTFPQRNRHHLGALSTMKLECSCSSMKVSSGTRPSHRTSALAPPTLPQNITGSTYTGLALQHRRIPGQFLSAYLACFYTHPLLSCGQRPIDRRCPQDDRSAPPPASFRPQHCPTFLHPLTM